MTTLVAGGATDVGRVRAGNEDQLLIAEPLYAVADGMGGHAAGEVASASAMEALLVAFDGNPSAPGLVDAVRDANRAVWEQSRESSELRGMGTTMTAVALIDEGDEEVLAIAHVGDSRAYLLRDGELTQVTEDHSVPEELRRAGRLSAEDAASDPRRHVLTRVLGVDAEVEVDTFQLVPYRGDRLLLASDGLFGELSDEEIASILRRRSDPERVAQQLVTMAKDAGGADNITVVVIDVTDDDDRSAKASAKVGSQAVTAKPSPISASRRPDDATEQIPRAVLTEDRPPPPPPSAPSDTATKEAPEKSRRPNLATIAFLAALILVLGLAATAVLISARGSFYVGTDGNDVAIFRGRPGGLLGFDPTLEERTDVRVADVLPSRLEDLRKGKSVSSVGAARDYVRGISEEGAKALMASTTSTTPPPATTAPPPAPLP
ncbi:MAG: Stp1/IreP family PP2C-type Ser/Thr phosphatase [Actinobacteria bacterium]|nr:Stp1/IreP family PP2C-type Ser/Thr phosphatase [Actinomycetota bacterium]